MSPEPNSLLNYGDFYDANLTGANLDQITLNRPIPVPGGFVSSVNMGDITGVTFVAADISALDHLGEADVISKTFGTEDTLISSAVRAGMLDSSNHHIAHSNRRKGQRQTLSAEEQKRVKELEATGFQHWSPHDSSDGITGTLREEFYKELGMKHWPFYD